MKEIKIKIKEEKAELIKDISQERNTTQAKIIKELVNKGLTLEEKGLKNKGFEDKLENTQEKIEKIKTELKYKEEKITDLEYKIEKLNKQIQSLNEENKYLKRNYEPSKETFFQRIKKLIFK